MVVRSFTSIVVAALLVGCATHYTWQASVPLSGTVGEVCLRAELDAETDVFDVIQTGEDRLAFRLSLPGVDRDDSPSFSLSEVRDSDGTPALTLSTGYAEGLFQRNSNAQLLRARALVAGITEECTGQRPTLGEPHPCGAGEPRNLCILGRY
jgi:hypothetical protein